MSRPCFFAPRIPQAPGRLTLDSAESQHAVIVKRLRAGDEARLIDGTGMVARARVDRAGRREIVMQVLQRCLLPRLAPELHLACAPPKGDRQRVLLDMGTQLGLAGFVALQTDRGVARPGTKAIQRWRRFCVEACKQSGNPYLPSIETAPSLHGLVVGWREAGLEVLVADPCGAPLRAPSGDRIGIAVGPEGGFTAREVDTMTMAGARTVSFGACVLRIETAAVAALAMLRQAWSMRSPEP